MSRSHDKCLEHTTNVSSGVVHTAAKDFAVRCVSVSRCAAVYAGGLHVVAWRIAGHNQLAAMVGLPHTFLNRTVGLMGLWSSNRSDDFLMSDGKLLPSVDLTPPSEERLHYFGLSCEWTIDTYTNSMSSSMETAILASHCSSVQGCVIDNIETIYGYFCYYIRPNFWFRAYACF